MFTFLLKQLSINPFSRHASATEQSFLPFFSDEIRVLYVLMAVGVEFLGLDKQGYICVKQY